MAKPTLRLRDWLSEGVSPEGNAAKRSLGKTTAPDQGEEDWSDLFADEPNAPSLSDDEGDIFSPDPFPTPHPEKPSGERVDAGAWRDEPPLPDEPVLGAFAANPSGESSLAESPLSEKTTHGSDDRDRDPFKTEPPIDEEPRASVAKPTATIVPHPLGLPDNFFGADAPTMASTPQDPPLRRSPLLSSSVAMPLASPHAPLPGDSTLLGRTLFPRERAEATSPVPPLPLAPPAAPPPPPVLPVGEDDGLSGWAIPGPEGLPHSIEGLVSAFAQQLIALLLAIHRGEIIPHGAFLPVVDQLFVLLQERPEQIQALEQVLLENPTANLTDPSEHGERDREIMEDLTLHLLNVTFYVYKVGLEVLDPATLQVAVRAAAIHDLGMARLPVGLLVERGVFSQQQREMMQLHPLETQDLVRTIFPDQPVLADLVVQEQERFNGSGYPAHLTGEAIHPAARLIGLIDTFEAMIHPRPYRKRLLPVEAVQRIVRELKGVFDPRQVKGLINNISVFPMGTYVQLNTKEIGRVMQTYRESPLRPKIEVQYNAKQRISIPRTIELSRTPLIFITKSLYPEDVEASIRGG